MIKRSNSNQGISDGGGTLLPYKLKKFKEKQLVIMIFNQEIIFDGETSTITYFRDITTSMLYEQILNE